MDHRWPSMLAFVHELTGTFGAVPDGVLARRDAAAQAMGPRGRCVFDRILEHAAGAYERRRAWHPALGSFTAADLVAAHAALARAYPGAEFQPRLRQALDQPYRCLGCDAYVRLAPAGTTLRARFRHVVDGRPPVGSGDPATRDPGRRPTPVGAGSAPGAEPGGDPGAATRVLVDGAGPVHAAGCEGLGAACRVLAACRGTLDIVRLDAWCAACAPAGRGLLAAAVGLRPDDRVVVAPARYPGSARRSDVTILRGGGPLVAFEVWHTHRVDAGKARDLAGTRWVEVHAGDVRDLAPAHGRVRLAAVAVGGLPTRCVRCGRVAPRRDPPARTAVAGVGGRTTDGPRAPGRVRAADPSAPRPRASETARDGVPDAASDGGRGAGLESVPDGEPRGAADGGDAPRAAAWRDPVRDEDHRQPDARQPDARQPDARQPDARRPDARRPDARRLKSRRLESRQLDLFEDRPDGDGPTRAAFWRRLEAFVRWGW